MTREEVVLKECNVNETGGILTNEVGALNIVGAILGRPTTTTKVRKAYKMSKQRQKWSDEEHQKFLEGLKLHGRAWRLIQDYIGTKTTVQIRSHAQKFFSKVERGEEGEAIQIIEIPPPRPKRKPNHPYPRKETMPHKYLKLTTKTSGPSQNPLFQDAAHGMDSTITSLPHRSNIGSENTNCVMQQSSQYILPCLKLFGQIVQLGSASEHNNLDNANSMSICSRSKTESFSCIGSEEAQLKHPSPSSSSSSSPDVDIATPHCTYNQHVATMCPHTPQIAVNTTPLLFHSKSCFKPWHPTNTQFFFHTN